MEDVSLENTPDGIRLPIRVQPGARRNAVTGVHNGRLKVAVTQVAERGKANEAVMHVLAEAFELRASQVELIAGSIHRDKVVLIRGVTAEHLSERIAAMLASS